MNADVRNEREEIKLRGEYKVKLGRCTTRLIPHQSARQSAQGVLVDSLPADSVQSVTVIGRYLPPKLPLRHLLALMTRSHLIITCPAREGEDGAE